MNERERFIAAMARRGVTDMNLVWIDPWSTGFYGDETEYDGRRYVRGICWVKDGHDDENGYAHPVENLAVLFDFHTQEILRVDDFDAAVARRAAHGGTGDTVWQIAAAHDWLDQISAPATPHRPE